MKGAGQRDGSGDNGDSERSESGQAGSSDRSCLVGAIGSRPGQTTSRRYVDVQATKKAAHERAADRNNLQNDDTMPTAVEQAVVDFKSGLKALQRIINVVAVQCYLSSQIEVQVASLQDLGLLPGELIVSRRFSGKYPYKATKYVGGIEFITLAEEEPK